jgi:glucose-6-phosphate dehydrogenase assembly protein OpcA
MAADLGTSGRDLIPLGTTARRGLDLAALRGDLAALWRQEGHGIARACHATLVVSVSLAETYEALLDDLVRARPSRVILLEPGPSLAAEEIQAWASGSCFRRPGGDALICSETIHLTVGVGAEMRIASAVRSLTVGGLPLEVLVLDGSPLALVWLERLGEEVDRVLFQSAGLEAGECLALWERCRRHSERPRFQDLTWAKLEGWRWAVASRFEGEQAARLRSLRRVTLSLEGAAHGSAEALLFAGWLGSRLGWTKVRRGSGSASGSALVSGSTSGSGSSSASGLASASAWTVSGPDGSEISLCVSPGGDSAGSPGLREVEFGFEGAYPDRRWRWNPGDRTWAVEDRGMESGRSTGSVPGTESARGKGSVPAVESARWTVPAFPETSCTPILRSLRSSRRDATPPEAMLFAQQLGEARVA